MQTSEKRIKSNWPHKFEEIFSNKKLAFLQQIMRQSERIIIINQLLQQYLPEELFEHCRVIQYTPLELTIAVDSAVWSTRLRYAESQLLQKLKQNPQLMYLIKIKVCIRTDELTPLKIPPTPKIISRDNLEVLKYLAESVGAGELQQALHKLMDHSRASLR